MRTENGGSLRTVAACEAVEPSSDCENSHWWYALQVRCRSEFAISSQLEEKGYPTLVPFHRCRKPRGTRFELKEVPLFGGYVFCRFDARRRLPIIKTPGVLQVVGVGNQPLPVDSFEIASLQRLTDAGIAMQPCDYLQVGNRVRIEEGPLKGVEGILIEKKGTNRIVVSITLLKRSVAVELKDESVSPLEGTSSERIVNMMLSTASILTGVSRGEHPPASLESI